MAVGRLISLGYEKEREGEKESEKSKMRFDYHPHNLHLRHEPSLNLLVYDKTVETLSQDNLIVQDYFGGCGEFERNQLLLYHWIMLLLFLQLQMLYFRFNTQNPCFETNPLA